MSSEKLAIVIATKNRENDLERLLKSISLQSVKPAQVIVVDGGDTSCEKLLREIQDFKSDYVRLVPPSLTAQRNAGIKAVSDDVTLIAFLDDDIVLEKDCIKNMMSFWSNAPENTAGAEFNVTNVAYKEPSILEKFFLVSAGKPFGMLRSGFQGKAGFVEKTITAEWLAGYAMVWRKKIFKEFTFDEWFSGYARYEDVDFSYRVGKKYKMYIVADARLKHFNNLENINFSYSLGRMEIINRFYFVNKNKDLSIPLCFWANLGYFLNNAVKGFLFTDKRYRLRAKGNISGFAEVLSRGIPS